MTSNDLFAESGADPGLDADQTDGKGGRRLPVLLPLPLAGPYDYLDPGLDLQPGDFVTVPLGRRQLTGVVWGEQPAGEVDAAKLKAVQARLDVPPMTPALRKTIDWVAAYTLSPQGAVLRMAMSVPAALEPPSASLVYRLAEAFHPDLQQVSGEGGATEIPNSAPDRGAIPWPEGLRATPARRRAIRFLQELPAGMRMTPADLARESGSSTAVLRGLAEAGMLERDQKLERGNFGLPQPDFGAPVLTPAQQQAAGEVRAAVESRDFSVTLLEGITGSGKTEVYYEAIAAALEQGRQVLVLLPEIALSAQWLDRFARRFGTRPAVWHSELGQAARRKTWRDMAEGRIAVTVGARSALFLPCPDPGLIIVDEEHEQAFKQDEGVGYHARDMAVVRARHAGAAVILASATPSLETRANAESGRYRHVKLTERHGVAVLPEVSVLDLKQHKPSRGQFLSPVLREKLVETLNSGEQAMLFLNRRGYAPLTLCRTCGHRLECPNCSAWLVDHRLRGRLQCHHCGHSLPPPEKCPECEAEGDFAACGPGVERIAEEVLSFLPDVRMALMVSDLLRGPADIADLVDRMGRREIDLLVGTQIMAKGHHFPLLTLVGVVDADLGLSGEDFRASERSWQLLNQVAGRAGRADRPGQVILQSWEPLNPVIQALLSGDPERFPREELERRKRAGMPPFGRLAALLVSSPDPDQADEVAELLARTAPREEGFQVMGPAPAPLSLLRGRHRRRLLVRADRDFPVQAQLRRWLSPLKLPGAVRLRVDIDPQGFM